MQILTQKKNIERAFDTLKCYIETYASRASKPAQIDVASKLEDALNVLIDFYNSSEVVEDEARDVKDSRDLYLYILLGGFGKLAREFAWDDAKKVPAEYMYGYITHEDHEDVPISKRIYNAVQSWRMLQDARSDYYRLVDMLKDVRKNAELAKDTPNYDVWQEMANMYEKELEEQQKLIRDLSY